MPPMRNIAAILGIAAFAGAAITAPVASATVPKVNGVVVCNPQTGLFDATWTVNGDPQYPAETATITSQSRPTAPTLVGLTVKNTASVSSIETNLVAGSYVQKITVNWTNGVTISVSGTVTASGECTKATTDTTPPPPSDNTTTTVPNGVVVGNPTPVKTPVKTPSVPTTGKVNKDLPGRTHPGRLYRMKITIHNNGKKPATYTAIDRLPKGMLGVVRQADGSFRTTNVLTTKVTLRPGGTYVWRPLFTMTPAAMYRWVTNVVVLRIGRRVVDTAQAKTYDPPVPGTLVTYIK